MESNEKEKLAYLRHRLRETKKLINRTTCPCCNQKIQPVNQEIIEKLSLQIEEKENELKRQYAINEPLRQKKRKERELHDKIERQNVEQYFNSHKRQILKYVKMLDKPSNIVDIEEKKLWNKSIELFVEDGDDFEDCFFDLSE